MIIRKELPETNELVIARVSKIMPYGAYCTLQEYGVDAFLPISEIASGWIKNIHGIIKEGQKEVAKVIFVDKQKRAVDISFKKVSTAEKKNKLEEYNLEKRAEDLFMKAVELSKSADSKEDIIKAVAEKEHTYADLVNDIFEKRDPLSGFKDKNFKDALYDIVFKNIKPKRFEVSYTLELNIIDPGAGVSVIREALAAIESTGVNVLYLGAPHYRLVSEDASYPKAEDKIRAAENILKKYGKKITFSMRSENKAQ
jgi:translation initiation factor 2 subunit 1